MHSSQNKYKPNFKSSFSTHSVITGLIGTNHTILDVGCNEGYLGRYSKKNIFYGLDSNLHTIKKAKKYYQDVIVYDFNNLQSLPWKIKFDIIIFADVLEHILFPEKTLSFFVNKYLKYDGKVIISLPNIANWSIRLKLLSGKFNYTETGILDRTHLHFYTYKTAIQLIKNVERLQINKVLYGASLLGPFIKIFPFLKGLLATNIIIVAKKVK